MSAAEVVYDHLLRERGQGVCPSLRVQCSVQHGTFTAVVVPNSVWRRGRVFLTCSACGRQCTRLYAPLEHSELRCRRCWGLTYQSTQQNNYKGGSMFAGFFWAHRDTSMFSTQAGS